MSTFMRRLIDLVSMPLTEQAFQRRKIMQMLEGINYPLLEHVLKLMVLEVDGGMRDHWVTECCGFLARILVAVGKNGHYLRQKDYQAGLFDPYLSPDNVGRNTITRLSKSLQATYKSPAQETNVEHILERLKTFYQALCALIARGASHEEIEALFRSI